MELRWHKLSSVIWADDVATFPVAPDEPGVYLVKVTLGDRYRAYVGEAANLRFTVAYLHGVPLINEHGFPPLAPEHDDPLR